jgi:hypothetical protein
VSRAGRRPNRIPRPLLPALAALASVVLAGCGAGLGAATSAEHPSEQAAQAEAAGIALRDVYIEPKPGGNGGYLVAAMVSSGGGGDSLVGVTFRDGATVTPSGGASSFAVPATGVLRFADPLTGEQGPTLNISGGSQRLVVGSTQTVTFDFTNGGQITMQVPVWANPYGTSLSSPVS